jgi:hypothetical protein
MKGVKGSDVVLDLSKKAAKSKKHGALAGFVLDLAKKKTKSGVKKMFSSVKK